MVDPDTAFVATRSLTQLCCGTKMKRFNSLIELTIPNPKNAGHESYVPSAMERPYRGGPFLLWYWKIKWFRRSFGVMFWATKLTSMGAQIVMKAYPVTKK